MTDLIPRALQRLRILLGAGTGRRRKPRSQRDPFPGLHPTPVRPAITLPRPRSPYGLHAPLDGGDSALVRPYLAAHERETGEAQAAALRQRRRLALVLAADFGIDLDRHLVGAREVAA
ncbi:hypothetical protein ACIRPX_26885 [Streptomyces sp. NPDC101225]|uniref:hypothetical protein n=1 Tax=Streptomyces sp. NPDC101225 TaxID=3366135 RepID=UPI00382EB40D